MGTPPAPTLFVRTPRNQDFPPPKLSARSEVGLITPMSVETTHPPYTGCEPFARNAGNELQLSPQSVITEHGAASVERHANNEDAYLYVPDFGSVPETDATRRQLLFSAHVETARV